MNMGRVFALLAMLLCPAAVAAAADIAVLADKARSTGRSTGQFFFVEAIDGNEVPNNVFVATRRASNGLGPDMRMAYTERQIEAGKHTLKLKLRTMHAAPIFSLFAKNTVDLGGSVNVDLLPGVRYQVNGIYDNFRRELWIEEVESEKIVSEKLSFQFEGQADTKLMEGVLYSACNLHYDGDWIGDSNYATAPMIPAGSRVKILELKKEHANVLIEGRKFRIGQEYGQKREKLADLLAKLLVNDDPRPRLQSFPEPVRAAVAAGKLRLGMNKEQVLAAMGPPRVDSTPDMARDTWVYYTFRLEPFSAKFDAQAALIAVDADDFVKTQVLMAD